MTLLNEMKSKTLPGKNPDDLPLAVRARIALREQGAKAFAEGRYGDAEALAGLYRFVVSREFKPIDNDNWENISCEDFQGAYRATTVFDCGMASQFTDVLNAIRADEIARAPEQP